MRYAYTLALALPLLAASPAPTPPKLEGARPIWVDYFGSPQTDWNNRFIELGDGQLLAAGFAGRDDSNPSESNWDTLIRKYHANGRIVWTQQYGGPELDAAWAAGETTDGALVLGGFSATNSAGGTDASLTLLDREGRVTADARFGGPGDDRATDVVELADGGFLLVGQSDTNGANGIDVFLVRTDAVGKEVWRRTYGGAHDDRGFYGIPVADGGAIIAGVTGPRGSYDLLVMRVASDGTEIWRRKIGGTGNDATHGLARLADGRVLLAGYGPSWNGRGNDVSVITLDDSGGLLDHQIVGGSGDDRVQSAAADPDGGAWLTGYTKSFSSEWRMLVARITPIGKIESWLGAVGGAGAMNGSTVALARNGDLLLGGYASMPSSGAALPDAFAMRVTPNDIDRNTAGVAVRQIKLTCTKNGPVEERCS